MKDNVFEDAPLDAISAFAQVNAPNLVRPAMLTSAPGQGVMKLRSSALDWSTAAPAKGAYRRMGKRLADIALVLMSLPMTLPVIAICAIALWLEGGQPFYRQKRLGEGGSVFSIWKLRTMCRDADQMLECYLASDPALRREWDEIELSVAHQGNDHSVIRAKLRLSRAMQMPDRPAKPPLVTQPGGFASQFCQDRRRRLGHVTQSNVPTLQSPPRAPAWRAECGQSSCCCPV